MKISAPLFSFLLLIGILSLTSCISKSDRTTLPKEVEPDEPIVIIDPVEPVDTIPALPVTVDVAVYTEYPEAIDGCACYFGKTATQLSEGKYIFMTNYEKKAYMELDGKMRVFELISSVDMENGELKETWSNENFQMVVKSTETGAIDETWQSIGTISITPTGKDATVISVVGECGC